MRVVAFLCPNLIKDSDYMLKDICTKCCKDCDVKINKCVHYKERSRTIDGILKRVDDKMKKERKMFECYDGM